MSLYLKAGKYLEEPNSNQRSRSLTVLLPIQGRNGYVFALASVNKQFTDARKLFDLLSEHAERLAGSFGAETNVQHQFEKFLRSLNDSLSEQIRNGDWHVPIKEVKAFIGIACDEQMFMSGTGDLTALFLHYKPTNRYQIYNLSRSIKTEQSFPSWEKAFAVVLDGDLHSGDVFAVANQELQRHISNDDLLAILTTLPPEGAAEKIRQYYPHTTDLAMIVLQAKATAVNATGQAQPLSELSIEKLGATEAQTSKLLEDQRPRFGAMLGSWITKRLGRGVSLDSSRGSSTRGVVIAKRVGKMSLSAAMVAGRIIIAMSRWSGKTVVHLSRKETRGEKIKETRDRIDRSIKGTLGKFNRLPSSSKYLMIAALAVIFVFVLSVSVLSRSKVQNAESTAFQTQVEEVESKIDQAAGAIIYKDEDQARTLYSEASDMVNGLTGDSAERLALIDELRGEIEKGFNELRHVVNIPDPPLVGDLSVLGDGLVGQNIFAYQNEIYLLGTDRSLYQIKLSEKRAEKIDATIGESGTPIRAAADSSRVFFLDSRPGLSFADVENAVLDTTALSSEEARRFVDIYLFSGRMYLLEPASTGSEGQIVRYPTVLSETTVGTDWIQSKTTDFTGAVSLAVDGTIFVLKQNGVIARFVSGSEVGWDADVVDPQITNATKIWTDADSSWVYVLEPAQQRLIIYHKETGVFNIQYRSDNFTGLTDFTVDETNRTIYLLSGTKVFAITASHL